MSGAPALHWLDPHDSRQPFPDPRQALRQPNGLLAAGGDLSVERLLNAYAKGIFPWFSPGEPILWWSPDPRALLRVGHLHRSRSLRRAWKRQDFAVTVDQAWPQVLQACSRAGTQQGVWLGAAMQRAYSALFARGHAHSLEIWRQGQLIGGVYGVARGRVFFAESMFSRADDASKLALWALDDLLAAHGYVLLDGQIGSAHLLRMGFELWPRAQFLDLLPGLVGPANSPAAWPESALISDSDAHGPC